MPEEGPRRGLVGAFWRVRPWAPPCHCRRPPPGGIAAARADSEVRDTGARLAVAACRSPPAGPPGRRVGRTRAISESVTSGKPQVTNMQMRQNGPTSRTVGPTRNASWVRLRRVRARRNTATNCPSASVLAHTAISPRLDAGDHRDRRATGRRRMRHETVDRHGTRSYPTAGPDREHIVPRDGSPPYFRERLAVTVKGKAMRDVFLYEPDTKEVRLESEVPTVKFGACSRPEIWVQGRGGGHGAVGPAVRHLHDPPPSAGVGPTARPSPSQQPLPAHRAERPGSGEGHHPANRRGQGAGQRPLPMPG